MTAKPVVTAGLGKTFGDVTALADLTLTLEPGEVFGYLGPNGAGKTTTLRLLLGYLRPTSGSAQIFGTDVSDVAAVHARLAYVPGDVALWPGLTGTETLHLLAELHRSVDTAYRDELVDRFDFDPNRRTREYSKGNRQKVALIAAFASRADLLILDEPTAGLDPLMEQQFRGCVRSAVARGQTVLLSSHLLSEVEALCYRVGILRLGRLVEVADVDQLRALHGTVLELDLVPGEVVDAAALTAARSLPGVSSVTTTDRGLTARLSGPPGGLLEQVGLHRIAALRSREASLEEAFLGYYGEGGGGGDEGDRV